MADRDSERISDERVEEISQDIKKTLADDGVRATVSVTKGDGIEFVVKISGFEARVKGAFGGLRLLLTILGAAAASFSLVSDFPKFLSEIKRLVGSISQGWSLVSTNAFAQSGGGASANVQIVPILVYLI
jgi:hypothetical protein